jgi:hypothetical protein
MYRAMISLYQTEPWAEEVIEEARRQLGEIEKGEQE